MSVATDIARSYISPRQVQRRRMAGGPREDRALAVLMAGCVLMFIAQWPGLSRAAFIEPTIPLEARLGGALMGWLFIMPLLLYILAGLTHAFARLFGGKGTWYRARMALFWALLAASPLWLFTGLVGGFVGPGVALNLTGLAAGLAFLVIWGAGLWEAEMRDGAGA
ncbi:MAG: YIP1 family protein [Pseudomonadota bacterium]